MYIIPGDVYFILLAKISRPVHTTSESCGNIQSQDGLIFAESFLYGIQRISKLILPNVMIGAVVIDTCSNAANAFKLLSQGSVATVDHHGNEKQESHHFDPSSVLAVLLQQDENIAYSEFAKLMSTTFKQWPVVSVGRHMLSEKEMNLFDISTSVELMLDASLNLAAKANWSCVHLIISKCYFRLQGKIQKSATYRNISTASMSWVMDEPNEMDDQYFNFTLSLILSQPNVAGVLLLLSPFALHRFVRLLNCSTICSRFTFIAIQDMIEPLDLYSGEDGCFISLKIVQEPESSFRRFLEQRKIGSKHQLPEHWINDYIFSYMHCAHEFSHERNGSTYRGCPDDFPLYDTQKSNLDLLSVNRLFDALLKISLAARAIMVKVCALPVKVPCKEFFQKLASNFIPYAAEAFRTTQVNWSDINIQMPGVRLHFIAQRNGSAERLFQVAEFDPTTKDININDFAEFQKIFARGSDCSRVAFTDTHPSHAITEPHVLPPFSVPSTLSVFAAPNPSSKMSQNLHVLHVPSLGDSQLFIGALLPLLSPTGNNVLDCSADPQDKGVLLLEALLWAVKKLEKTWNLDVNLLILNTCGSAVKADIVLQSLLNEPKLLLESHVASKFEKGRIIGFINDPTVGAAVVASQILSEASIINIDISGTLLSDSTYAVDLSQDVRTYAYAVAEFLSLNRMNSVSLVYSRRKTYVHLADLVRLEIAKKGVCVVADVELGMNANSRNAAEQLFLANRRGSNASIVLADHGALSALVDGLGEYPRDSVDLKFIFVILPGEDDEQKIHFLSTYFSSSVLLMSNVSLPAEFYSHLQQLHYERGVNNSNIWWRRFWERKYNCTPSECHEVQVSQNAYDGMLSTDALLLMNAISALFYGAHMLEEKLCLQGMSQCEEMVHYDKLGSEIVQTIMEGEISMVYDSSWRPKIRQSRLSAGNLTFYFLSSTGVEKIPVIKQRTLYENISTTEKHAVGILQSPILPTEYYDTLTCKNSPSTSCSLLNLSCQLHVKAEPSGRSEDDEMIRRTVSTGNAYRHAKIRQHTEFACLFSKHQVYMLALLPVHDRGYMPLTCGSFSMDYYQQWQAIKWSVERLNHFMFAEMGVSLGALAVDSCADETFGLNQIFSLLQSGAEQCISGNISDHIVATVLIPPEDANPYVVTARLFSGSGIPVLNVGSLTMEPRDGLRSLAVAPSFERLSKSIISLLRTIEWTYVGFVYIEDDLGFQRKLIFNSHANDHRICVENVALSNIPDRECKYWQTTLSRLFSDLSLLSQNGMRGVVLDIPDFTLHCFFQHMEHLVNTGLFQNDLFTFITTLGENFKQVFSHFEPLAAGFVILHPPTVQLKQFNHYWNALPISSQF
ncbi:hypothetical protein D918_08849 [Trichuris suis]|nr:hypothetical protein D918_08849 [Trichuris suis]